MLPRADKTAAVIFGGFLGALVWWACARTLPALRMDDNETRAAAIVWAAYGKSPPAPRVTWRRDGDCDQGRKFTSSELGCVAGVTHPFAGESIVARPPGMPISETALAHELYHLAGFEHADPGFGPDGAVDRAKAALRVLGL